jgi:hypothetical protein
MGFLDLLDPSNDPEFFWQVISGPLCIQADSRSPFIRNFLISQNHINMKIGS